MPRGAVDSLRNVEKVQVTRMLRRGLRLQWTLGFALVVVAIASGAFAQSAPAVVTQTTLSAETRDHAGQTRASFHVAVRGADGQPAAGAVVLLDGRRQLAGAALGGA